MNKMVLVPLADGTEEAEAVCTIDLLRRAGAEVTAASVGDMQITASRGLRIVADCLLTDCLDKTYDLIAVPGGLPGAEHLRDSADLTRMLKEQHEAKRWIGAICAAPVVVLQHHRILTDETATAYPAFADRLGNRAAVDMPVVVDGHLVTSRGVGTAVAFGLKLVEVLYGPEKAREVSASIVAV